MLDFEHGFCGGEVLWDTKRTWYTFYPRFTKCFEWTVLGYAGAAFLWPMASWSSLVKKQTGGVPMPQTFWSILNTVVMLMLILCHLCSMVWDALPSSDLVPLAGIILDLIHCASCVILLAYLHANRKAGRTSSSAIWMYWLIETLTSAPKFYRVLLHSFGVSSTMVEPVSTKDLALITATFSLTALSFVLNSFSDSSFEQDHKDGSKPWPLLTASPMSVLFFEWFTPFMIKGFQNYITEEDLFKPLPELKTSENYEVWLGHWNRELERAKYNPETGSFDKRCAPSLLRTLSVMFWPSFALVLLMLFARAVMRMGVGLMVHLFTSYIEDESQQLWKGILYCVLLITLNSVSPICLRHSEFTLAAMGIKIKAILTAAIYQKTLKMSSKSQSRYATGELVNLVSIDAEKILKFCRNVSCVIVSFMSAVLSTAVLWQYFGPSCLAGLAVTVVMTQLSALIAAKNRRLQEKQMDLKDSRLKSMSEIINSMKILKLFAWETPFAARVGEIRDREISLLKRIVYMTAGLGSLWACTSSLMCLLTFTSFILVSPENKLTPMGTFVSLTLFQQLRLSMLTVPDYLTNATQTAVAFNRIWKFLICEEINPKLIGNNTQNGYAITIRNLTAAWSCHDSAPVLSEINLSARKGELIAIVGPVGSGKSSMISSMLGDLNVITGTVDIAGSIAYVPQQAWIQNETIRKNITFISDFDRPKYEKVLETCCLRPDLRVLPGGDLTEIGEKGINLSGGQRQRVALARAAYQDKDIYIFDDPLSALDAHVGKSVFDDLIGPSGMLSRSTRILVTNNLSFLPNVDYIVVLRDGKIEEEGTYKELLDSKGALADLLRNFDLEEGSQAGTEAVKDDGLSEVLSRQRAKPSRQTSHGSETTRREPALDSAAKDNEVSTREKFKLTEKETVEVGAIRRSVYVDYFERVGFTLTFLMVLFYAASQTSDIICGLWLSAWSEDENPSSAQKKYRVIVFAAFVVCQGITSFFAAASLATATIKAATDLHQRMLRSVMRAPLSFFDTTPVGRLLNRFGPDLDQLDMQLPSMAKVTVDLIFRIIGVIVLISTRIPSFLLAAIPIMTCFVILRQLSSKSMRQIGRLEAVRRSPVYSHFSETINGLSSIRGFGVGQIFQQQNGEKVDAAHNCSLHVAVSSFWISMRLDMLGNLLTFAMTVLVVTHREYLDGGTAGLLIAYSLGSMIAFNSLIFFSSELEATMVAAERIVEYTGIASEAEWKSEGPPHNDWPSDGAIAFENYGTRYRPGLELILDDVNLTISSQQKVGVVGRTGAGKSSLILTIFRVIEAAMGRIVIDGLDIAKIGLHELRAKLTIIPQESVLFKASLRFNLDPNSEYSDEELWQALERAHLKAFFERQSGLDTPIAEGGGNISVGQRQLLCLGRAVLRRKRILVLDEATASVDLATDALIQETIRSVFSDSTIITIAHRINTILASDVVVVMSAGKVTEVGHPRDLLKNPKSQFTALAKEAGISCDSTVAEDSVERPAT